jgi:radical SAM superfamily enzyme YgiQ (UPF0313 family)
LLREVAKVPGIKKVFVRSGIRYDYMLQDKNKEFFSQLVNHHISGQLKVAPEHCVASVLDYMGKPHFDVFEKFWAQYKRLNEKGGKEQYLVPYLMSSHPGCTLNDAVELAEFLKNNARQPEQVQDFYPTPGTISTVIYYTGIHPMTGKSVYVCRDYKEKQMQRALLQYKKRENYALVKEALKLAGREDLIGNSPDCLIRDYSQGKKATPVNKSLQKNRSGKQAKPSNFAKRDERSQKPTQRKPITKREGAKATYKKPNKAKR